MEFDGMKGRMRGGKSVSKVGVDERWNGLGC